MSDRPSPLPSHIVDAWSFVHGTRWCFEAWPSDGSPMVAPALALTVALRSQSERPSLLVGCLIRQEDAEALARHMFDAPDGELSPDDVRDAGQEACNVLAGSVLADRCDRSQLQIGLPQSLSLAQYEALTQGARVRACWVGRPNPDDSAVRVVLTVFDPPASA